MIGRHKIRIVVYQWQLPLSGTVFTYVFPDGRRAALFAGDRVATWGDLHKMFNIQYF